MLRRAGKARSPGGALASDLAASGQCQRARFVTEVAQLLPKGLEVIDPAFVDLGMVAAAYQLVLFETEYATFELAGYRHRSRFLFRHGGPYRPSALRPRAPKLSDQWKRRLANGRDILLSAMIWAALRAGTPWITEPAWHGVLQILDP